MTYRLRCYCAPESMIGAINIEGRGEPSLISSWLLAIALNDIEYSLFGQVQSQRRLP
jgi:hypothetical protein